SLLQDFLHGRVLQVRRVAIFAKQALHQNPHSGASRLPMHPVHRNIALNARHQLVRNDPERGFAHTCRALSFSASVGSSASSAARFASNALEMYLRKIRPSATCL